MSAVTPMLLGIHGKRRSGKDTTATILTEWVGDKFTARRQGFADDMKKSGLAALGTFKHMLDVDDPYGVWMGVANELKEHGTITIDIPRLGMKWSITGLEFWQLYGTEAHRDIFHPDFWVNNLLPKDKGHLYAKWDTEDETPGIHKLTQLMMVTDVRFPNEAKRIKDLGGFVLQIRRPEADIAVKHDSEKPLPANLVDEVIVNDEGLDEFKQKVLRFAERKLLDGLRSGSGRWD